MIAVSAIPGYYTPAEAADIIGVSQSQITRYIQDQLLPGKKLGHQILIEQAAVHRFERPQRGNPNFRRQTA